MATQLKNNLFQLTYFFSAVCSFCFSANKSRIYNLKPYSTLASASAEAKVSKAAARPYKTGTFTKKNSGPLISAHLVKRSEDSKPLSRISSGGLVKEQIQTTKKFRNKVAAALPKNTNLFCLISINRTKNNTHAVISNLFGENKTKWSISAGQLKLPGGRRKTRLSQRMIYKSCSEKALSFGYKFTVIHCRGTRGSKVRIFRFFGDYLSVLLIKDITGTAHNGCRPPKVRRV